MATVGGDRPHDELTDLGGQLLELLDWQLQRPPCRPPAPDTSGGSLGRRPSQWPPPTGCASLCPSAPSTPLPTPLLRRRPGNHLFNYVADNFLGWANIVITGIKRDSSFPSTASWTVASGTRCK